MVGQQIPYDGTIVMLGFGVVAQCTLPLVLKHFNVSPTKIIILDKVDNSARIAPELRAQIRFHQVHITAENYSEVLAKYLKSGDTIIDLAYDIDCCAILQWTHDNNILYINTSVEVWDPYTGAENMAPTERTLYARHMKIRAMIATWENKKGVTAVIEHGANPGLVSHFAKKALLDITEKLISEKPEDGRIPALQEAREQKQYAKLAYLLAVKVMHISERDTQTTVVPRRVNEFVNTWSIQGLLEEGFAPAELGWGTHETMLPNNAYTYPSGPQNQICLAQMGIQTWVRSWVPSGDIYGMVIRHGESFTLSEYLTHSENGKVVYRPTVHYAYCPTDSTLNSLHELKMRNLKVQENFRILRDEINNGADELGVLLMGHDFSSWWTGTVLSIEEARQLVPGQNATTVQVAAGVIGALSWMIKNPQQGVCVPDDLPHEEILAVASPYLGAVISQASDWHPLKYCANLFQQFDPLAKRTCARQDDAVWQFSSFLVEKSM